MCELSKNDVVFDRKCFTNAKEAMNWADELRLADHYIVTIYDKYNPDDVICYICDRDPTNINLTHNLFAPFKD